MARFFSLKWPIKKSQMICMASKLISLSAILPDLFKRFDMTG
jgi:hypothetical protein